MKHGQAERNGDPLCLRENLKQDLLSRFLDANCVECVLAPVPRNAELWKTQHADLLPLGRVDRCNDAITIAIPVKRRLVEHASSHLDQFHTRLLIRFFG